MPSPWLCLMECMNKPIIVALDYSSADAVWALVERLSPNDVRLKIGFELYVAAGPALVSDLVARGFDVFLDLKFHDIPNTVAKACKAASDLGVWMMNVHASGGAPMMAAAREALAAQNATAKLIAVTVLTSMSDEVFARIGCQRKINDQVMHLAKMAQSCGLDGVVCSAREAEVLRTSLGSAFDLVTPGVRPAGSDQGDQHRVMTPEQAIAAGSNYLVIGRPITQSDDPLSVIERINQSVN